MSAVDRVLKLALSQQGYTEKASADRLDSPNENPGSGNYTKYARDLDAVEGFYNGKKQGFAWCDVFVDWCFVQCFGAETARRMLCQPRHSAGAGCTFSAAYYKQQGRFFQSPAIGDQIFFGDESESVHTGIVWKTDGGYVYTVEGNAAPSGGITANGGQVCLKSYALSYGGIYGYGRPRWELAESAQSGEAAPSQEPEQSGKAPAAQKQVQVSLTELSYGAVGQQVAAMQQLLELRGFACGLSGADGDFGPDTAAALLAFQKTFGLEVDEICGKNSWRALIRGRD